MPGASPATRRSPLAARLLPQRAQLVEAAHGRGDRRAVHLDEVVRPVDDRGVEGERRAVLLGEGLVERQRPLVGEAQLGGGVLHVEVEVAAQELQPPALLVELAGQVPGPVAARRVADRVVRDLPGPLAGGQQPLHRARAREPPLRQPGRAAVAGGEGVPVEVGAHRAVEHVERQRVAVAAGDVEVADVAGLRRVRQHRDDRGDDVVHRDDVDDGVRGRGELRELAAAVGQDQRLRHLEALDPADVRLLERGLDDARPDDARALLASPREVGGPALDDPLAHRLGERVAVGPAQAAGPLGADPDQLVLDPLLARRLGGAGGGEQPGPAVLLLGLLALPGQQVRLPGAVLDGAALAEPPGQLGVQVDVVVDRGLRDAAAAAARDVRRGDVDVVDVLARVPARLVDPGEQVAHPDHVGREALVDGRVERHVARAVHDRVDVGRQRRHVGQVALDDRDPRRHQRLDATRRLHDVGEDRLLEQLGGPVGTAGRPLGPDQDAHPQVRDVGQDEVQQRLADEAGDAGEQDVLPRQTLRDRPLRHARDRAMWVRPVGVGLLWSPGWVWCPRA